MTSENGVDYSDLKALDVNCTLKKSPELSHTQGLIDRSVSLMRAQGVKVDTVRFIDLDVATGIYPDMREHGWPADAWLEEVWPFVDAADILVVGGPLSLGDNASITRKLIERLYAMSGMFNERGQYVFYGKAAGALITGNEDGVKHPAMSILYSLQHIGYVIPPAADAGWIGEVGPGPSYLDPGSGGPENDFTNRNTTFMTWNLLHLARMLKDAGGIPAFGNLPRHGTRGSASGSTQIPSIAKGPSTLAGTVSGR
jgi:multimeric flavodoxin WrbA